jgi:hypothetical protein
MGRIFAVRNDNPVTHRRFNATMRPTIMLVAIPSSKWVDAILDFFIFDAGARKNGFKRD